MSGFLIFCLLLFPFSFFFQYAQSEQPFPEEVPYPYKMGIVALNINGQRVAEEGGLIFFSKLFGIENHEVVARKIAGQESG